MPVLNVVRDEPQQLERTRSLAAAGRSPTLGSIRSARQRAGSIAAPGGDAEGPSIAEPLNFAAAQQEDVVRPPSRINSLRRGADDGASAPAVAPQKVLVKRLKSTSAAQRSAMPNPAQSPRFSGDEVDSRQGSVYVPSDNEVVRNSIHQTWGGTNVAAHVGSGGYRSGGDGGESDAFQVEPVSLGSGGEEERTVTSARGGGGDEVTSQHTAPRSASASHTVPPQHHSRTSSVNNHPTGADDCTNRGAVYGDVGVRSTPDHWASSASVPPVVDHVTVDTTSHAPSDIYNPARSVGTVQSQRMIFESSGQPLIRPQAASSGTPPPPPPLPQPNWKQGDTPRGAAGAPLPPPPLPPPPRRLDNYDIDQKPLPDAASVRTKVEQLTAREVARMESERLQQPGRPSLTTFSRLDLGNRSGRDDDDGQYSLATEENGNLDSARTVDDGTVHQKQEQGNNANGISQTPPSSVRHPSREKRGSPSRVQSSGSARAFIPVSPIAFSIEFDGMNAVLLDQLSDSSLNRIVDELQSVIYDAVRGPAPSKGSVRVERMVPGEDSDSRTVVEGFVRGMRSASDRRLAIRLLVSYFRGPSGDAVGVRLAQFPALVRDANAVSVRRMYINDVDVALLSLSSPQNSPHHHTAEQNPQGALAAFEARRTKLSMTSTPSIVAAAYHPNGTPREVSPLRYPDRQLYHHISTPTPSSQKVGQYHTGQQYTTYHPSGNSLAALTPNAGVHQHLDPMRSPPAQQPNYSNGSQLQPGQTDVAPYYSPSNNYGVTRYRTRKYEYH
jgi:hypothetical protein